MAFILVKNGLVSCYDHRYLHSARGYTRCQKFFPILDILKSPLPPFDKVGNYKELLLKSSFDKGGFRKI